MSRSRYFTWALAIFASATLITAETRVTTEPVPFEGRRAKTVMDDHGNTHLIFNKQGNIFYSRRGSGEEHFRPPIQVNTVDRCAAVGEIAIGKGGRVHVLFHGNIFYIREQIKSEGRKMRSSDIKYTFYCRLNDAGDGFEKQQEVSENVWGFDGGCAIAADPNGNVYLFVNGTVTGGNELKRDVFMRHSSDNGKTFSAPRPVGLGKGVCACCHLKAQVTRNGDVMFTYRVAEDRVDRDSYVLTSHDGGKTFSPSPVDKWKLRACPGSVYSFANAGDATFVSWRTENEIYLGKPGAAAPISPPGRMMNRRAAVLGSNHKGEILIAWAEGTNFNKPHSLQWQLFDKTGNPIGKENAFERWGNPAIFSDAHGEFVILY